MVLVTACAAALPRTWRGLRAMDRRAIAVFAGIGVLVALHWLTFYASIKLSNASVAATCMAVAPVFMVFFEPWILRTRFDPRDLLVGIAAIPGVVLVVGGTPSGMRTGIVVGVVSAALAALFGVLNKRHGTRDDVVTITGVELATGAMFLGLAGLLLPGMGDPAFPGARDAGLLLVLAFACTLLPFSLSLVALRRLSAFSAQLAVSLEPVYAILLAILLLGEQRELDAAFYLGVAIILGSVFAHTAHKLRSAPA